MVLMVEPVATLGMGVMVGALVLQVKVGLAAVEPTGFWWWRWCRNIWSRIRWCWQNRWKYEFQSKWGLSWIGWVSWFRRCLCTITRR
jgi:hypothetical protein